MKKAAKVIGVAGMVLALSGYLWCGSSLAAPTAKEKAISDIRDKLKSQFPKANVGSISSSPVDGIYEVVLNDRNVVYVDRQVNFLFDGELVDLKQKKSLTQQRVQELSKIDFNQLPLEDAFKIVRGKGSRKLAVFSDPDCPFCKKLEQESLKDIDDVTIYLMLYPLSSLHPDAERKAALVWCAKDRAQAWQDLMLNGKEPEGDGKCDTPIKRIAEFAAKHRINGTPGLVFENGKLVPGAIPKEEIERELAAASAKK